MNIHDDYFGSWPDMLEKIKILDGKRGFSFMKNLAKDHNATTFLSTITEIHFGLLFDKFADSLKYDQPVFGGSALTPDWTLTSHGQTIVAEVFRLNPSEKDQSNFDFDEALNAKIKEINISCYLQIDYDEQLDVTDVNIDYLKIQCENWLTGRPENGQSIEINGVKLKLLTWSTPFNYALAINKFRSVKRKQSRLDGDSSRLFEKIDKYAECVSNASHPFIICIYLHSESWFELEDIRKMLFGNEVHYVANFEFEGLYPDTVHHDLNSGLYYSNETVRKNLSGILIWANNKFTYYHNYSNQNRLNRLNKDVLIQFEESLP